VEILLSADPKEPDDPLAELRLRPVKAKQPYYLYLRNPSEKPRKVLVQLAGAAGNLPGEARVELGPKETKQVRFTGAATPSAPPPTTPSAEGAAAELGGELQVRLLDLESGNKLIDARSFRVQVAPAADYTKVTRIQFTPPTERDQSLGGASNRL